VNAYYQHPLVTILCGDCREASLENISAIVTDPPYGLEFMGKEWDRFSGSFSAREDWAFGNLGGLPRQRTRNIKCPDCGKWVYDHPPKNCSCGGVRRSQMHNYEAFCYEWASHLRKCVLPGSPLLSFGGSRTQHRIAVAIEDAGWEIRDTLMWVYGSGFPKSLDISKAIDKQAGAEREVVGKYRIPIDSDAGNAGKVVRSVTQDGGCFGATAGKEGTILTAPATPEAQLWEGYGTALKPAYEPIILAMNPLDGTFANNALKHKVAGLNIDGCRVEYTGDTDPRTFGGKWRTDKAAKNVYEGGYEGTAQTVSPKGRFPANFLHDGSQMVLDLFPLSKGQQGDVRGTEPSTPAKNTYGEYGRHIFDKRGDNGSAARFFYCAKASKAERDRGLEDMPLEDKRTMNDFGDQALHQCSDGAHRTMGTGISKSRNNHPTVKPLALMEYLVKLVKYPEYNLVLDPFMGSGTTLLACIRLGIPCIGIDSDEQSCEIAARRCSQEVMEVAA